MKKLKFYAGIVALATSITLSSCAKKEADFSFLEQYDFSDGIGIDAIEEIARVTKEKQERSYFDNYIGNEYLLDYKDFINMEQMSISLKCNTNTYSVECESNGYTYKLNFDQDNISLISYILNHTNCDTVYLSQVSSEVLDAVTSSTKIKTLSIKSSNIDSLETLSNLTNLELLSIADCPNIDDISALEKLNKLNTLVINGTKVSDVTPLSNLTNLTYLNLRCNEITNPEVLSSLEKLESILLEYNKVTDIDQLKSFLDKDLISDVEAECIVETTTNHKLIFKYESMLEDARIANVTYYGAIDEYYMETRDADYNLVSFMLVEEDHNIYELTKNSEYCNCITFNGCNDDNMPRHIYYKTKLESVTINNCDFESLYFLSDYKDLLYLTISNCPNINYEFEKFGIFEAQDMENLKYLTITDTGIENLDAFALNKTLESVVLKNNKISDYSFLTELPNLKVADLTIDTETIDYEVFKTLLERDVLLRINGITMDMDKLIGIMNGEEQEKEYKLINLEYRGDIL